MLRIAKAVIDAECGGNGRISRLIVMGSIAYDVQLRWVEFGNFVLFRGMRHRGWR